jgi:hypothetical protein
MIFEEKDVAEPFSDPRLVEQTRASGGIGIL